MGCPTDEGPATLAASDEDKGFAPSKLPPKGYPGDKTFDKDELTAVAGIPLDTAALVGELVLVLLLRSSASNLLGGGIGVI